MSEINKYSFYAFCVSFGIRVFIDFVALSRLSSYSDEEYAKTGKPSFLWSGGRWMIYFDYLMRKQYLTIKNIQIVKLFTLSRTLLIVMFISMFLFFSSILLPEIVKVI